MTSHTSWHCSLCNLGREKWMRLLVLLVLWPSVTYQKALDNPVGTTLSLHKNRRSGRTEVASERCICLIGLRDWSSFLWLYNLKFWLKGAFLVHLMKTENQSFVEVPSDEWSLICQKLLEERVDREGKTELNWEVGSSALLPVLHSAGQIHES